MVDCWKSSRVCAPVPKGEGGNGARAAPPRPSPAQRGFGRATCRAAPDSVSELADPPLLPLLVICGLAVALVLSGSRHRFLRCFASAASARAEQAALVVDLHRGAPTVNCGGRASGEEGGGYATDHCEGAPVLLASLLLPGPVGASVSRARLCEASPTDCDVAPVFAAVQRARARLGGS